MIIFVQLFNCNIFLYIFFDTLKITGKFPNLMSRGHWFNSVFRTR